jgi:O-antigen ligase
MTSLPSQTPSLNRTLWLIAGALLVALTTALGFWHIETAAPVTLAVALWLFWPAPVSTPQRLHSIDVAVLLILTVDLISTLVSTYPANSLPAVSRQLVLTVFYAGVRRLSADSAWSVLRPALALYGTLLALMTLIQFNFFQAMADLNGLSRLTEIKFLFHPFGQLINEWSTVFILFLPAAVTLALTHPRRWLRWTALGAILLLTGAVLVGLSRGVYLALFAFWITLAGGILLFSRHHLRRLVWMLALVVLTTLPALQSVLPAVRTTVAGVRTTSQQRSMHGRLALWQHTARMIGDHPWTGVGPGNFAQHYGHYMDRSPDSRFATRAFNTVLHLGAERGLAGALAYLGLLLALALRVLRRCRHHPTVWMISAAAALLAVTVRDLTFSTWVTHDGTRMLAWLWIGVLAHPIQEDDDETPA